MWACLFCSLTVSWVSLFRPRGAFKELLYAYPWLTEPALCKGDVGVWQKLNTRADLEAIWTLNALLAHGSDFVGSVPKKNTNVEVKGPGRKEAKQRCSSHQSPWRVTWAQSLGSSEDSGGHTSVVPIRSTEAGVATPGLSVIQFSLCTGKAGASSWGWSSRREIQVFVVGNEGTSTRSRWAQKW